MAIRFYQAEEQTDSVRNWNSLTRAKGGFTLVELLVSTAIMLVVILVLLQVIAGMTNIWHNSTGSISTFQAARAAFTTITRTLSRATLKTYIDYVDAAGNPVTNGTVNSTTPGTYVPIASFARASQLQFVCGPTWNISANAKATPLNYPGSCVFFQAPMGIVSSAFPTHKYLERSLNAVGFYVEYNSLAATNTIPGWLKTTLTNISETPPRFRLMQFVQPAENMTIYTSTAQTITTAYTASFTYINNAILGTGATTEGQVGAANSNVVLAENIVLLVLRPRLEPPDENTMAPLLGTAYNSTTANSIISPNYNYDSRVWWSNGSTAIGAGQRILSNAYASHMRNQLPPIIDVAMVAVDPNSIIQLGAPGAAGAGVLPVPPAALQAPQTSFGQSTDPRTTAGNPSAASLDLDLTAFGKQLSAAHVRYRIFRSSVQMEGAAWVND